ncbi:MAG: YlmH/Sll1252 family protein [Clostridia bacterium]
MESNKEICKKLAKNDDEYLLLTKVLDKYTLNNNKSILTHTNFLDEKEQLLITTFLNTIKCKNYFFDGGYDDAIRKVCFFKADFDCNINGVSYLRVIKSKQDTLAHKDYLGSLMGQNIKREMFGDIIVTSTGADIILMSDILDTILLEYNKVGRKSVKVLEITRDMLSIKADDFKIISDTVSSLRLDLIVSSAFLVSRNTAKELILKGKVLVNSYVNNNSDKLVNINDKLNIRGMGKAELIGILGKTKKDKYKIEIRKY